LDESKLGKLTIVDPKFGLEEATEIVSVMSAFRDGGDYSWPRMPLRV